MPRKHQHRAAIIADNLSTPFRPRSPKAPKPLANTSKRAKFKDGTNLQLGHSSARVRTNDAPSDMGKASARFHDPVGNAFKARKETKAPKLDMSYRWSEGEACDGDQYLHDARERDRLRQFIVAGNIYRDRGFKPEEKPRDCPVSIVSIEPARIGKPAKVTVRVYDCEGPSFVTPSYSHYTHQEAPRPAYEFKGPDYHAPRIIPLPAPSMTARTKAPWNHPKPRKGLVVTVVTKTQDTVHDQQLGEPTTVSISAPDWNAKTRKALFNRIPIQSRSAKKRGFRLVPRIPNTVVYGHLA